MTRHALGIDIGGTKILVGLVDETGTVLAQERIPTPATQGGAAVLASVLSTSRKLLREAGIAIEACGVGTAGVVDANGVIVSATDLIRDWVGAEIGATLHDALGVPIVVRNDVHAAAVCEASIGAASGYASALVVSVGTGIGGAIVRNGVLDPGATGIAGSIGHILSPLRRSALCSCGAVDHIEAHASGPAIEAEFAKRTGEQLDLRTIAGLDGDAVSSLIAEVGEALGASIGTAINLLDCEVVVVGGGVAELGARLFDAMKVGTSAHTLPPARGVGIVPARHGPQSCMVGAGLAALSATSRP